jgi:broad specificity phosphatase PhoE
LTPNPAANPSTAAGPSAGPASSLFGGGDLPDHTDVWLIRHGETEWSASGQHTGRTDIPLTPAGEEQARAIRALLDGVEPVLVVSSPLQRALRTAELAGLRVDEVDDDLAEWNYGEYEGITTDDIQRSRPSWSIWCDGAPGGETPAQVGERADRMLGKIATRLADGPIVLVGHGHFGRALGVRWIGVPISVGASLLLGTAAPCRLGAEHGVAAIAQWNLPNPAA